MDMNLGAYAVNFILRNILFLQLILTIQLFKFLFALVVNQPPLTSLTQHFMMLPFYMTLPSTQTLFQD